MNFTYGFPPSCKKITNKKEEAIKAISMSCFPRDVCIIGILSLTVGKWHEPSYDINNYKHLCLKFAYIVLRFVDDKGGEIYELMLWTLMLCLHHQEICELIWLPYLQCLHHQEIYELMLWLPNLHYAMFASCVKISRTCIVILRVDILPCDEMLQLINTWNVCVMISKAYIAI